MRQGQVKRISRGTELEWMSDRIHATQAGDLLDSGTGSRNHKGHRVH